MELKTGRRVSITGNIFENTWTAAQSGYAVNIKPGTGKCQDASHHKRRAVRQQHRAAHVAAGLTVVGTNSYGGKVSNVTIRNNLFDDLRSGMGCSFITVYCIWGCSGHHGGKQYGGAHGVHQHAAPFDLAPSSGLTFRGNIAPRGTYGVFGSGSAEGTRTLTAYFPGAIFTNNVIYNSVQGLAPYYPTGNYFPLTATEVGWTNVTGGNYTLASTSTYKGTGVGGLNPGVDMAALLSATAENCSRTIDYNIEAVYLNVMPLRQGLLLFWSVRLNRAGRSGSWRRWLKHCIAEVGTYTSRVFMTPVFAPMNCAKPEFELYVYQ